MADPELECVVRGGHGAWRVERDGEAVGDVYPSEREAALAAVALARDAGRQGARAQVVVHGAVPGERRVWTYGRDEL
jgi:hypothetical protein